ncbi:MAG: MarR family transcriptional regulator [Flavobacterium sp.]|nr:MAG: MarR family transcriptional regulator [Flavobacterium sp.]
MTNINRTVVLNSLIKHETLTITDMAKEKNLGVIPDKAHLNYLIKELIESGHVETLNGVIPSTYTITSKGIQEGERYPTIAEYINDWNKITPVAREALVSIDDQKLDSIMDMGEWKMPYYDMICFTIYREASIIGQIALWRRLLGY